MDRENIFIQGLNNKTHREGGVEEKTKKERSIWTEKRSAGAVRAPSSAQREKTKMRSRERKREREGMKDLGNQLGDKNTVLTRL